MSKKLSKRVIEALEDVELARGPKAGRAKGGLKPIPLTEEELRLYERLKTEIASGKPAKDSLIANMMAASLVDMDSPETSVSYIRGQQITWQAVDSNFNPINKGQYYEQEAAASKRDVTTKWNQASLIIQSEDGNEIDITESRDFSSRPRTNLSPLRKLAVDIVIFKYDSIGEENCIAEINQTYESLSKKKYANKADLDLWKQNCLNAVRKIVSAKNHWNKIQ